MAHFPKRKIKKRPPNAGKVSDVGRQNLRSSLLKRNGLAVIDLPLDSPKVTTKHVKKLMESF
jgi:hypothetical protein